MSVVVDYIGDTFHGVRHDRGVYRPSSSTGGRVLTPAGEFDARTDVDVEVVYVPALPTRPAPAFVDAEHVFDELGVRAVSHDQAGDVARRARELLGPLPK